VVPTWTPQPQRSSRSGVEAFPWTRPALPLAADTRRPFVDVAPLESLLAELQLLQTTPPQTAVPVVHRSASRAVKQEGREPQSQSQPQPSAAEAARASETEVARRLWDQLRAALHSVVHSATAPVSTLMTPLRQLLLLCCTPATGTRGLAFASSAAALSSSSTAMAARDGLAPRAVKLELRPPSFAEIKRSHSDAHSHSHTHSGGGDEKAQRRQMLRLLLQLLFFCVAKDADLVCARQLAEELCAPPASTRMSAVAADSARSKLQPMLPPELNAQCWEWAPLPAARSAPEASSASSSDESDAAVGPSTRLVTAMSWPTLLSALFDESLAALSGDHSSRAVVLGSLSLLELLLAVIDSALFVGAKQPQPSAVDAVRELSAATALCSAPFHCWSCCWPSLTRRSFWAPSSR
jgi:hypothetical protein